MKNKWQIYEQEKQKVQLICKTSEEYEQKIKELISRLKI